MSGRVVVIGSSNTDMVIRLPRLPVPGETVLGGDFLVAAGGKGANQAVAAARLGAQVTFIARLGQDSLGDQALENLRSENINTEFVLRDDLQPSGVALIMVGGDGENMIAVAPGANSQLSPADIDRVEEAIGSGEIVLIQLETALPTVERAIRVARSKGVPVILNPAPAPEKGLPDRILQGTSLLTPNLSEMEGLTGTEIRDRESVCRAAEQLRGRGVGTVVMTWGSRGACVLSDSGFEHYPGYEVEAVDATAAGDAFNGALAARLAAGKNLEEAVMFANQAAALAVTRMGAQPSLPSLEEVTARIGP